MYGRPPPPMPDSHESHTIAEHHQLEKEGILPHPHSHQESWLGKLQHVAAHWLVLGAICLWFIANTITFPLEHTLWDKMWPFSIFGHWLEHSGHPPMWTGILILLLYTWMIVIGTRYAIKKDAKLHDR